jgi:two-component sensor histidine kinase
MALMLLILAIIFGVLNEPAFIPTLIGISANIVILSILYYTRKYRASSIIFAILGASLSIYTLLSVHDKFHFVDPLWMLIVALYTYFTLGRFWGNIAMAVQFGAIAYFLATQLNFNLSHQLYLEPAELLALVCNLIFCALIIAYLIHQFIKRNSFAVNQYKNIATELQHKNKLVEQQNKEKTAMLKEIHHRVKNNLQVITSLLRLQSREIDDNKVESHFQEAINRIGTMALIHNKMYQSQDLSNIDAASYLEELAEDLIKSYALDKRIQFNLSVTVPTILPSSLVPIALIFNELFSNSLKHAFEHEKTGEINVSLSQLSELECELTFADNGKWKEPRKEETFGLELIETLAHQLNGEVSKNVEQGTKFVIKFTSNA